MVELTSDCIDGCNWLQLPQLNPGPTWITIASPFSARHGIDIYGGANCLPQNAIYATVPWY